MINLPMITLSRIYIEEDNNEKDKPNTGRY